MTAARLLTISVCLNLLFGMLALRPQRARSTHDSANLVSKELTNRNIRAFPQAPPSAPAQPLTIEVVEPFHWSQLESEDYRIYTRNLRSIGCPETTVRDIVRADVKELFQQRVKELVEPAQQRFWEFMGDKQALDPVVKEKQEQLEALAKERNAVLEELLGSQAARRNPREEQSELERFEARKQTLDFLPESKRDACLALEETYHRLTNEASGKDREEKLKALDRQHQLDLRSLLNEEEFDEYKLRNSRFAEVRLRLTGFDAGENELKQLARIAEKYAGAVESREPNVDVRITQRAEAQKLEREEIKQLLGPDRLAQYDRAQDERYREIYALTDRLGLPATSATQVYDIRNAAEAQAREVRTMKNLTAEERREMLGAIRAETERSVTQSLGEQPFSMYYKRSGQWLEQLETLKP
jgi:hypothetical protein